MKLKIRKATKHEREHLLEKADSESALYPETVEIIVDNTKSEIRILVGVIHELCRAVGMSHEEADDFTNQVLDVALGK